MTAINLDEDLSLEESRWRGRLITLGVLLLAAAVSAVAVYYFFFTGSTVTARPTEDVKVERKTINSALIVSGVAAAQFNSDLTFQSSGKVAKVNVKVGDVVTQGQLLASLESDDLANNAQTARANLRTAQLKLEDLLDGSTAAELAAADQAVASAEATVTKAKNDLQDLLDGASAADLATAQQAVRAAQSQLSTAQANRDKLGDTPNAADRAAAQAAVASTQSALTAAQNNADSAQNALSSTGSLLKANEGAYCNASSTPAFCAARVTPISSADAALMYGAIGGVDATLATKAKAVIDANSGYLSAVNTASSAQAAVSSAQDALTSAQKKLTQVQAGPSAADIAAADAAVTSAQAALDAANKKLADVRDGATDLQKSNAQAAVDSAEAALVAAQARRDEAVRGPTANQLAQAREAVHTAQLAVDAADIRLRNAQISAPFDGTVAQVNAKPGEFASQASQTPAIVLLTPNALQFKMNIGETDYSSVQVGKRGGVLFDGIPGKVYPFVITEIGLSPTVTQGVVTYEVKASLVVLPDNPRPAPGMNARGQIISESHPNVLAIPPRAITRRGNDQVVEARRDGVIEDQVITTGLSDNDNVEVLTGLAEGDIIVVPALTSKASGPKPQATLPGGIK